MEKFDARKSSTNNIRRHYEQNIVYFLAITLTVIFLAVERENQHKNHLNYRPQSFK